MQGGSYWTVKNYLALLKRQTFSSINPFSCVNLGLFFLCTSILFGNLFPTIHCEIVKNIKNIYTSKDIFYITNYKQTEIPAVDLLKVYFYLMDNIRINNDVYFF